MNKYPAYKDSGVDWLGDVPERWDVKRLKWVGRLAYGDSLATENRDDGNVSVFGSNGIVGNHSIANTLAPMIVVGRKGSFGKLIYSERTGFCIDTTYFIDSRYSKERLRWLFYALQPLRLDAISQDTGVPGLSREKAYENYLPVPPTTEQQAIADFLDRRTSEIDDLIAKKERVIELLREKRTALISHAVTKGLNPDAKMRDSGIDWLGDVPEHWEVKKLKRISKKIQTGCTPPTAQEYYYEDGTISWYGPGNFGDDLILGEASKLINESAIKDRVARLFEAGSTMIVAIGATIGKVGYIDKPASSNQQITAVTPNITEVFGKFLAYQLKRLEQVLKGIAPNTTLPIMDQQKIGCLMVANPPISEQQAIAAFLDCETSKIDALIAKVIGAIEKLKEYRTALISAAVTGKIDVREEG